MQNTQPPMARRMPIPARLEVRYDRAFLADLKRIEPNSRQPIQQFALEEFFKLSHFQELPEFHPIGSSGIFYRFTLNSYLVSLELTGQIVKFLRVVRKPEL
jgi:hypothetical protein